MDAKLYKTKRFWWQEYPSTEVISQTLTQHLLNFQLGVCRHVERVSWIGQVYVVV